jgi:phage shock protein PspC (stress-responsive transcriptional regulator)
VLFGVAGGLADALGLDALIVRLAFVGLGLLGGFGVMVYLAAGLAMRDAPTAKPVGPVRRVLAVGVGVVALATVVDGVDIWAANWLIPLGLLGVGAALWPARAAAVRPDPAPGSATAGSSSDTMLLDRPAPDGSGLPPDHAGPPTQAWAPQPPGKGRPPKERSILGRLTLAAALIAGLVTWLAANPDDDSLRWAFSAAALACGAGLLVGTVMGRARWLIGPALLAGAASLAAGAVAGLDVDWGERGDEFVSILSPADIQGQYDVGIGTLRVDMSQLTEPAALTARVGIGDLDVFVPSSARLDLTTFIGAGEIDVPGAERSGYRRKLDVTVNPSGSPTLTLDLAAGIGSVSVHRGPPFYPFPDRVRDVPEPPVTVLDQPYEPAVIEVGYGEQLVLPDGSRVLANGDVALAEGIVLPTGHLSGTGRIQFQNGYVFDLDSRILEGPDGFVVHLQRKAISKEDVG